MNIIKEILSKPLFKVISLNGISILIKIFVGFITSKFIAIFVGPSGLALVGNLRNFLTTTEAFASLGFENGVVKYVAEHQSEEQQLKKTISTIFITVLFACLAISLGLFFLSDYLNNTVFGAKYNYGFIFKSLAVALPFYIGNIFLIATINGFGAYKKVIYINIIGSLIGLLASVLLIWKLNTEGALLSIIVTPSVLFLVSFVAINQELKIVRLINLSSYNLSFLKNLSSYSLMALVSAVFGPLVFLAIRKNIILTLGLEQAGFWEAMTRISSYYFMFITSLIAIYYLPKLAIAKDKTETKALFWNYFKGILPLFTIGMIVLYFLRNLVIQFVFSEEFLPVSKLFFWQLLGDVFKAAAFILGYQFYAKKLTKAFIVSELFSLFVLYFSSIYLVAQFSIEGVVMAHAFTYFIYFITLCIYFRKSLFA
ncbi:O-antigen translocase [Flavobacterium sp.]|uniref:O-antigen translocase n=1 Tax=Flavobacterium sp. TaxID=239 RepID=UPI0026327415|nr:O-antigen translocase [Flavobacterium sp.]